MTTTAAAAIETLRRRQPEWTPWLQVIEAVVHESGNAIWDRTVPAISQSSPASPLLANASIAVDVTLIRRLFSRLGLHRMPLDEVDGALFAASLCDNRDVMRAVAARSGVDADSFRSVVALLCVPFLQACHRAWATLISPGWIESYCPVCAAWPAFVEVRGIERHRYSRCGRCGAAWHAHLLRCPYCRTTRHEELVTLAPQHARTQASLEACTRCRGYIKAFTTLQGCAPTGVIIEDLASVDLDVAALDEGYTRPQGAAYPLRVRVIE